jgi:hypothetical protein
MSANGAVAVQLSCLASEARCAGTLSLETHGKVQVSKGGAGGKPRKRKVRLGRSSFRVPGGHTATVQLHLSKKNQRLVRKLQRVRVLAIIAEAKNARTTKDRLTLRIAEPRR